jgi:ABC-2 type transport system permease protein
MTREIRQRARSKAFAISTAVLCIGVLGAGALTRVLSDDGSPTKYRVAVVGELPDHFADAVAQTARALDIEVRFDGAVQRDEAERRVRDDAVDAAIDAGTGELVSHEEPADELAAVIDNAWQVTQSQQAAAAAGLDDSEIEAILSPSPLRSTVLNGADDRNDGVGSLVGMSAAVVLFIAINAFGGLVLTGVVEEKSSGVVEVLLAHVRAHQLLAGKVFGIAVIAMAQMSATVAAGLIALRISGRSIPRDVWVGLPTTVFWFLLGFLLYSTLFALAGSFVSRQEDAQSAAAPISMVFTIGYLAVFALGTNPSSTVTRIVSVLPPFAPLLMPLRMSVGSASIVEIAVAALALLAATFGMLRLAGSVYGRTLLHRGSRLRWKQALRMRS